MVADDVGDATTGTDAAVIRQAWQWPDRFGVVFDRYYRAVYAYAARRVGGELAEDVAAETFLVAFDRRGSYDTSRAEAKPWLFGIASNLMARHRRTEQRRYRALSRSTVDSSVDGPAESAAGRVDAAAMRGRLAAGLSGLSAADREVLLLVAWAGLSCQEAATALQLPAGTARSRLHRARRHMRAALGASDPTIDIGVQ